MDTKKITGLLDVDESDLQNHLLNKEDKAKARIKQMKEQQKEITALAKKIISFMKR